MRQDNRNNPKLNGARFGGLHQQRATSISNGLGRSTRGGPQCDRFLRPINAQLGWGVICPAA
eukprot:10028697-Lingulodinium_polyedra.AAC.1